MVLRFVGRFLPGSIGKSAAEQWYDHGVGLQRRGQLEEAVQAYNNRGAAYINLGKPELAIPDMNQAIVLKPNWAVAHSARGLAHTSLCQLDEAVRDLDEAIGLNPRFAYAYSGRGIGHKATGRRQAAIDDFTQAIRVDPRFAVAYNNWADTDLEMGQVDRNLLGQKLKELKASLS